MTQHTNTTQILELCEYHPSEYQWNCNRPSPIGNPFHTPDTAYDATPTANDQTATNAAFFTAMYAVLSDETSTLAEIAAFHNPQATYIQLPYKDMTWTLYTNNFKRTLTRLQLYRLSLNRQNPNKATIHLRLLTDSHPSSSHLQPIAPSGSTLAQYLPTRPSTPRQNSPVCNFIRNIDTLSASFHSPSPPTPCQALPLTNPLLRFTRFIPYPIPPDFPPSTFPHQPSSPATLRPNLHSVPLDRAFLHHPPL